MALSAHQTAVGAVHRGDFAGEAANAGVLDRELGGIGGVITIDVRTVLAFHRVDERVAHHARLSGVRIVAEVAVDAVVDGADHVDGVRAAVELGAVDLVAHVGPVEHQVGRLAGPAHGVARGGGTRLKGLVFVGFGMIVLQDVPNLVGLAAFERRVEPAFLRFETAAEGAVDDELVDRHEGVGARKVVFLREAVRTHGAVKEGIGRGTRGVLLRLTGRTVARRKEGFVLIGMAGAAGGRVEVDRRARLHVGEVLIQTRVAGRAGDVLVRRTGVILGDRAVAGSALCEVGGRSGHCEAEADGREHERQRGMSEHGWGLPCNRLSEPIACRLAERLDSMVKPRLFQNDFFKVRLRENPNPWSSLRLPQQKDPSFPRKRPLRIVFPFPKNRKNRSTQGPRGRGRADRLYRKAERINPARFPPPCGGARRGCPSAKEAPSDRIRVHGCRGPSGQSSP